jgi:hypothetical protein
MDQLARGVVHDCPNDLEPATKARKVLTNSRGAVPKHFRLLRLRTAPYIAKLTRKTPLNVSLLQATPSLIQKTRIIIEI